MSRSQRAHANATSQDAPVFLSQWPAEARLPQTAQAALPVNPSQLTQPLQ